MIDDLRTGQWVLIDGTAYLGPGTNSSENMVWAEVTSFAPGTAAVYPVRVRFRNGLTGQYKFNEISAVADTAPEE